jgi:uncharacterized protein YggE
MRLVHWLNCLFLAGLAFGQDAQRAGVPTVRAHGEATINVKPDMAQLNIGVVTQGQTADAAAGQNAKQTADVISALKKELGTRAEIQTSGYTIHPNYRNPRDGSTPPTIAGYTATNTVHIRLSDISAVGKMIDTATRVGANNVHGIQFSVKDEQASRGEALRAAVRVARANAESMAAGLGLKTGRLVSVSDGDPVQVVPFRAEMMMAQRSADATPVEPGNVQVRAVVTVTFELQ